MTSHTTCSDVEFAAYPRGKRVEVTCGLPARPRPLELFVPGGGYGWGSVCLHTLELARAMLLFTVQHAAVCEGCEPYLELPDGKMPEDLCGDFAAEVLAWRRADEGWSLKLGEVFAWLKS